METISSLILEKNNLPIGNVYKKTINNSIYYYYQYFSNGKRYSKLIIEDEYKNLKTQIARRKEIESILKAMKNSEQKHVLSWNAKKLTGYIMNGNTKVAEFENGNMLWCNSSLAPLVISRTSSIQKFLSLRVLDMSRTNARILKKLLNIKVDDDYMAALYSYALSINDNYWFKPKHSKLKYEGITFKNDNLFETSLRGNTTYFPNINVLTPELTTTGSYEKGWKYINNEWWLYKTGNKEEYFSELFCYNFAKLINLDTAIYEMDNGYIRTKNFSPTTNFEPLASILDDNEDYNDVFNSLCAIDQDIAKQYIKLIFFDAVIYNIDRHNENVGLLRDRKTGNIISLAPNFDNNIALFATTKIIKNPKDDSFLNMFIKFIKNNNKALSIFKEIEFINITKDDIQNILNNIDIKIDDEIDLINKIFDRYFYIISSF